MEEQHKSEIEKPRNVTARQKEVVKRLPPDSGMNQKAKEKKKKSETETKLEKEQK